MTADRSAAVGGGPAQRVGASRVWAVALLGALLTGLVATAGWTAARAEGASVRIGAAMPRTLDPAAAGDQSSAAVIAQLFESVSAFDPDLNVRPALARSWAIEADGRRVVFHLRPGLTFSDGSPLTADDVVRSWLRVIDPARPSPLAALLEDVVGATAYLTGQGPRDGVAIRAAGDDVVVDLVRPAADFPEIVAGPAFGVVPASLDTDPAALDPSRFVGSGGYRLESLGGGEIVLVANERYWAGQPAIETVVLVTDFGGRSPVDAFERGDVDYVSIGAYDASWIAYDADLGPSLRSVPVLAVEYYGFDSSRPPFDDPLVRRAFAAAADWARIVELADGDRSIAATSMVPPGIAGRSERDFGPVHDPEAARGWLAEAGFPGGRGFPDVVFLTSSGYAGAAVAAWERELGIRIQVESMRFDTYYERLESDPPAIFSVGWIADYPGPNDFLGVLLGTGRSNNFGRWASAEFDAAIGRAGAAIDPGAARLAYDEAESIVQTEAPVIPLSYATGWALSRSGLLGASENGLGMLRLAGLAWADGR